MTIWIKVSPLFSPSSIWFSPSSFPSGKSIVFDKTADPHAVCGLIKLWLRELPTRLIGATHYEQLLASLELDDRKKTLRMREIIHSLPQISLFVLQHFVSFMRVVASYSQYSKMTPSNLAIVFGPNIMQPTSSLDPSVNVVMEELIVHYDFIFRKVEKMRLDIKRARYQEIALAKTQVEAIRNSQRDLAPSPPRLSTSSFTSQIHKQGYLTKKGEVRRNWSTRWFVLKYNWLGYYKGPEVLALPPIKCLLVDASSSGYYWDSQGIDSVERVHFL
jgi:hypothetical protein